MLRVFNLLDNREIFFDDLTVPEYAVRYCHAVEDANLATWFFNASPKDREILKITNGRKSISCGNWATKKGE